ncbi:hypothetical protein KAR48_04920 [bacterium]|nr:hypothetical protein [bacterium]
MAERAKGNVLYEILIVLLVVGLIAAILYPSKVWKQETEMEKICHARMDALYQMELNFRLSEADTYTDSVSWLRDYITTTPTAYAAMDSLVKWEDLILEEQLETMVKGMDMPADLRKLMASTLAARKPLKHLGKWDDLGVKLIKALDEKLLNLDDSTMNAMVSHISWPLVLGEDNFFKLLRADNISKRIADRVIYDVTRKGVKLHETRYWDRYYKKSFFDAMRPVAAEALREDVWVKADQKEWEVQRRVQWEEQIDLLSDVEKDSLWEVEKSRFWDKEREVVWMKDRKQLWKDERDIWVLQNEDMWKRIIMQRWTAERKRSFLKEAKTTLPDSLRQIYPVIRDSLWRVAVDSLQANEYPVWYAEREEDLAKDVIEGLWSSARRVTWEETAFPTWVEGELQSEDYWVNVKERLWRHQNLAFWIDEEVKLAGRTNKRYQLDVGITWIDILGEETIDAVIAELALPDAPMLWDKIQERKIDDGAILFGLGVQNLFKSVLIDSIFNCPTAHVPYHIEVVDTSAIKYLKIFCPIEIREDGAVAISVDPVTNDTTEIEIALPGKVKILGGGVLKNHGNINDERKSWAKN